MSSGKREQHAGERRVPGAGKTAAARLAAFASRAAASPAAAGDAAAGLEIAGEDALASAAAAAAAFRAHRSLSYWALAVRFLPSEGVCVDANGIISRAIHLKNEGWLPVFCRGINKIGRELELQSQVVVAHQK